MAVDASLAGRTFPPTDAYDVTEQAVSAFAAATGTPYRPCDPAPAPFPIEPGAQSTQGGSVIPVRRPEEHLEKSTGTTST